MKTPKEAAEMLIEKFRPYAFHHYIEGNIPQMRKQEYSHAIECAIVCVEEILSLLYEHNPQYSFWLAVKSELETK